MTDTPKKQTENRKQGKQKADPLSSPADLIKPSPQLLIIQKTLLLVCFHADIQKTPKTPAFFSSTQKTEGFPATVEITADIHFRCPIQLLRGSKDPCPVSFLLFSFRSQAGTEIQKDQLSFRIDHEV